MLTDSIPHAAGMGDPLTDPISFLIRAHARHGNLFAIRKEGPVFSRVAECAGVVAALGVENQRAILVDTETFGLPISAAEKLKLPQNLVNLNRSLHSMRGAEHAAHKRLLITMLNHAVSPHRPVWEALEEVTGDWIPGPVHLVEQIRELVPLAAFRDHLALCGALVARDPDARWEEESVLTWLQQQSPPFPLACWVALLGLLAATNIALMSLYALSLVPAWWPLSLALYLVLYLSKHGEARNLFVEAYRLERSLEHVRAVLFYLETHRYTGTPRLAKLCAPFWRATRRPSRALKQIIRIAGAAGVQQSNLLGFLINALVPWDLYFAHRLNQYKETIKTDLPVWIDTWYELEALNALANFGALHPDYVFPDVLAATTPSTQPVLRACGLGHPLLPHEGRVCNDFTLAHVGEIALITGSNMSGKSTFLRTLGVNLCLAYAGAPVNATALQTILLRLFTCIKVSDSVTDGISYFYAEVRRLKALLHNCEAEEPIPLCFLIDEIFRGTNNRERLIGSRAYIHALARGHGVGVISTHDLELVTLADTVLSIRNYHFREEVHEGRMVFDYRLRPGPCPTTNALQIMQIEGLPIADVPAVE